MLLDEKTIASIVCISEEDGLDLLMNFPKSVNSSKFIDFLRELRDQQPDADLAIFMDRLNVHRSHRVQHVMDELGILRILNSSYSPNHNPIEGVIGVIKNELKRQRTHEIAHGNKPDLHQMLENIGANISKEVCVKFILKSNYILNQVQ
jgi:transposase